MNEKLSLQNIADALAQKANVSKKVADSFSKAFFDAIGEALAAGEESVKVKGLGTFKLVSVESRESVNVTNGERIIIPGYKKVSFTPEEGVVSVLNQRVDVKGSDAVEEMESAEELENVEDLKNVKDLGSGQEDASFEALIAVPEPTHVEQPQNAFAGIDMLISTPESVEEVRQQYEEAKAKMEEAVAEARKANAEKVRLEKLLERLEQNVEPEDSEEDMSASQAEGVENETSIAEDEAEVQNETQAGERDVVIEDAADRSEEEKRQEAFMRVMGEKPRLVETDASDESGHKKTWLFILIGLFLAAIVFFIYQTFANIEAVKDVPQVEQLAKPSTPKKKAPSAPKKVKKTPAKAQQTDSIKGLEHRKDSVKTDSAVVEKPKLEKPKVTKEDKPSRPKTHVMQRGESLTRISQKYYGTKDSVRAIIRVNTFNNPDNVPVGAVVKLP